MFKKLALSAAAAALAATPAIPLQAQGGLGFSGSYKFLTAVRDRKGEDVEKALTSPGTPIVNTKDPVTGDTALHIVAARRDLSWLSYLIGKGARTDIQNKEGNSPLAIAAQLGWMEGAELLLAKKAPADTANGRGETPLILAVQRRDLPMVRLLVSKGADPRRPDRMAGLSALDYAKRDGRSPAIVKVLSEVKAPAKKMQGPSL
jgi:ankyrin repeat protein